MIHTFKTYHTKDAQYLLYFLMEKISIDYVTWKHNVQNIH